MTRSAAKETGPAPARSTRRTAAVPAGKKAAPARKTNGSKASASRAAPTPEAQMDAVSHFDLLAQLPHLLRRAHFEAEAKFGSVFGDQLTSRQLALLMSISKSPGMSQSEIAQRIGLDPNTCSDLVARTLAKKLIRRERSPTDKRVYCLYLTHGGINLVRDAVPRTDPYAELVAERLKPADTARLVKLLRSLLGF